MKTTKMFVAAAALSGLLMGAAARTATALPTSGSNGQSIKKSVNAGQSAMKLDDAQKGKHDCKGKNACKGQGGCKTGDNGCKAKNTCKGHGGCKTQEEKKLLAVQ